MSDASEPISDAGWELSDQEASTGARGTKRLDFSLPIVGSTRRRISRARAHWPRPPAMMKPRYPRLAVGAVEPLMLQRRSD